MSGGTFVNEKYRGDDPVHTVLHFNATSTLVGYPALQVALLDATTGSITLNLPNLADTTNYIATGYYVELRRLDTAYTHTVTIHAHTPDTISGHNDLLIGVGESIQIIVTPDRIWEWVNGFTSTTITYADIATIDPTGTPGMIMYNHVGTISHPVGSYVSDGTNWIPIFIGATTIQTAAPLTGTGTVANPIKISSGTNGDILQYDSTAVAWIKVRGLTGSGIVYVDPLGNDGTAQINDPFRAFATIATAAGITNPSLTDNLVVIVRPGTYVNASIGNLVIDRVTYYFMPGVVLQPTTYLFNFADAGLAKKIQVFGDAVVQGPLLYAGSGNATTLVNIEVCSVISATTPINIQSNILADIEISQSIVCTGASVINIVRGTLNIDCGGDIIGSGANTVIAGTIAFGEICDIHIIAEDIISPTGTGASVISLTSLGTTTLHIECDNMEQQAVAANTLMSLSGITATIQANVITNSANTGAGILSNSCVYAFESTIKLIGKPNITQSGPGRALYIATTNNPADVYMDVNILQGLYLVVVSPYNVTGNINKLMVSTTDTESPFYVNSSTVSSTIDLTIGSIVWGNLAATKPLIHLLPTSVLPSGSNTVILNIDKCTQPVILVDTSANITFNLVLNLNYLTVLQNLSIPVFQVEGGSATINIKSPFSTVVANPIFAVNSGTTGGATVFNVNCPSITAAGKVFLMGNNTYPVGRSITGAAKINSISSTGDIPIVVYDLGTTSLFYFTIARITAVTTIAQLNCSNNALVVPFIFNNTSSICGAAPQVVTTNITGGGTIYAYGVVVSNVAIAAVLIGGTNTININII